MNLMLSFVGTRDPFSNDNDTEGAVISLAHKVKPDEIILFAAYDPKKSNQDNSILNNLEDTEEWLTTKDFIEKEDIITFPLVIPDPRDYEKILRKVKEKWEELNYSREDIETWINLSSGTSQQASAWLLMADSGLFPSPHLMEVANPIYVADEQERISEVHPTFLKERNILQEVRDYLENFEFAIAHRRLSELVRVTVYPERKELSRFFTRLFEVYKNWDYIKYNMTYDKLNSLISEYQSLNSLTDIIEIAEDQLEVLSHLRHEQEKETPYNLVDLYFNALRCYKRDNYTDTLARFWRLAEGFYYYLLRDKYEIEPNDIYKSKSRENKQIIKNSSINRKELNMFKAYKALKEVFEDREFINFLGKEISVQRGAAPDQATESSKKLDSLIEDLRDKRNASISAHGMKPVTWDDAQAALACSREFMKKLKPEWFDDSESTYPFSPEVVNIITEKLKSI